jgi:hypothetical protein
MRRALFAAMLLVACSGGVNLDQGNAFPCDFGQGEGARDRACPSGYVCGVANLCQPNAQEGLPSSLVPPRFDGAGAIAPVFANQPVVALARQPNAQTVIFERRDGQAWVDQVGFGQPLDAGPATRVALSSSTALLQLGPTDLSLVAEAGGSVAITSAKPIASLRSYAVPLPGGVHELFGAQQIGGPVSLIDPSTGTVLGDVKVNGLPALDAREVSSAVLGEPAADAGAVLVTVSSLPSGVSTVVLAAAFDEAPENGAPPSTWTRLGVFDLQDDGTQPLVLQRDPTGALWALETHATFPQPDGGTSGEDLVAAWSLNRVQPPSLEPQIDECIPCPNGVLLGFVPVSVSPPRLEALCNTQIPLGAQTLPQHSLWEISAGPVDPNFPLCTRSGLTAPFDLSQVTVSDSSAGGQVAVGGAFGQLWYGERFTTAVPMSLDRVPTGVGGIPVTSPFGDFQVPLTFTDDFFAAALPAFGPGPINNGFSVLAAQNAVTGESGFPRAAVDGTEGWFIGDSADLVHVSVDAAQPNPAPTTEFGPQMLSPTGDQASPPFHGAIVAAPDTMLLSAFDSLYLYQGGPLIPIPHQAEPLRPQTTLEPGFPIQSLTVDHTADAGILAYAITSNALFQVSYGGAPAHWSQQPIVLGAGEPVKVWMQAEDSGFGRVGFRDGTLFSLPSGLPLAEPIPGAGGAPVRVEDFANFGGWPIASTAHGLFIAQPPDGGSALLRWHRIALADGGEPWAGLPGLLAPLQQPDGGTGLLMFAPYGVVFEVGHLAQ